MMSKIKVKLKEITTVKNGSTPSTSIPEYYNGEIIWITPKDLSNQNQRYVNHGERAISKAGFESCSAPMLPKGTILMSSRAPIGLLSIAAIELCTNQGFKNFIPDMEKINGEFLYYHLKLKINEIEKLGSGTTFKEVSKVNIENFEVLIPENPIEQQKIANVLSALDSKIELNHRIHMELEAMAKTIYDYWFVQFDFPNADGKPYKSSGGQMVWNTALKRAIPAGWEVGHLNDIAVMTTGKLDANQVVEGGQYPFFTCAQAPLTIDSYAFDDSVILIAGNNAAGNFHINRYKGKFNAYQRTYVLTTKSMDHLDYLFYTLKMELKQLKDKGQGSQTKFLTMPILNSIQVFKLDKAVSKPFHAFANPIFEKQTLLLQQNKKLIELRDWLLPMLMNGQVTVR